MKAAAPPPVSATPPPATASTATTPATTAGATVVKGPPIARPPARNTPTPQLVRAWLAYTLVAVLAFTGVGVGTLMSARTTLSGAESSIDQLSLAENIRTNVLRADASAAHLFLGSEDTDYRAALAEARVSLIDAAHRSPADAGVLRDINRELDVYAAKLEEARIGRGTPAGSAALDDAADHLLTAVLPALTDLVQDNSARVEQQTSGLPSAAMVVTGILALAGLIGTSIVMGIRFRRVVNLGLAAALVLVAGSFLLAQTTLTNADTQVTRTSNQELALFEATAAARGWAYDARAQEGRALIDQTNDPSADERWIGAARQTSAALDRIPGPVADDLQAAWADYVTAHEDVRAAAADGRWDEARRQAVSRASDTAGGRFTVFDAAVTDAMAGAGSNARTLMDLPRAGLTGAAVGVGLAGTAALLCVLAGVRPRLREYT